MNFGRVLHTIWQSAAYLRVSDSGCACTGRPDVQVPGQAGALQGHYGGAGPLLWRRKGLRARTRPSCRAACSGFPCAGAVACSLRLCMTQVLDLLEDACKGLLQHIMEHDLAAAP